MREGEARCWDAFGGVVEGFGGDGGSPDTHLGPTGSRGEGCTGVLRPGDMAVGTLIGAKWCNGVVRPDEEL